MCKHSASDDGIRQNNAEPRYKKKPKRAWNFTEDETLQLLYSQLGKKWVRIA